MNWEATIAREKAICDTMRKCILPPPGAKAPVVMAEGFVPAADAPKLAEVMRDVHEQTKQAVCEINSLEKYHTPPTYFRTNKITDSFQAIVNTYGWPRYKEANPGLFTIFTFPFLFGIMYGDIGHGTLLTLFSLYLIWKEDEFLRKAARKELGEMFGMAFGGRYLLVAMGVCAVYCGIMYNDCFSVRMLLLHAVISLLLTHLSSLHTGLHLLCRFHGMCMAVRGSLITCRVRRWKRFESVVFIRSESIRPGTVQKTNSLSSIR